MQDIDTLIRQRLTTVDGDFKVRDLAREFVTELRSEQPLLLASWLDGHAETLIVGRLNKFNHIRKRTERSAARQSQADRARKVWGEGGAPDFFETASVFVIDDHSTRRRLGEMTGADHLFVANTYRQSAEESTVLATFHEAVAREVGDNRTADVLSGDDYLTLYRSVVMGVET